MGSLVAGEWETVNLHDAQHRRPLSGYGKAPLPVQRDAAALGNTHAGVVFAVRDSGQVVMRRAQAEVRQPSRLLDHRGARLVGERLGFVVLEWLASALVGFGGQFQEATLVRRVCVCVCCLFFCGTASPSGSK